VNSEARQRRRGRTTRAINAYMTDKKGAPAVVRNTFRPVFHFYPDDQIEQLRERVLLLLETHGVAIEYEKAGALLRAAGATQTSDGKCYKLPRALIENISWELQATIYN
jgi:trimethylamine:corrinoid methyltransferase-like protein